MRRQVLPLYLPKLDQVDGGAGDTFHSLHHHEISATCATASRGEHRVCSDVVQFLAFLLLHVASLQGNEALNRPSATASRKPSTLRHMMRRKYVSSRSGWANLPATKHVPSFCGDCPVSYAPVHVKVPPEPTCDNATTMQVSAVTHKMWPANAQPCPQWCLAAVTSELKPTGSGSVEERVCLAHVVARPEGAHLLPWHLIVLVIVLLMSTLRKMTRFRGKLCARCWQ